MGGPHGCTTMALHVPPPMYPTHAHRHAGHAVWQCGSGPGGQWGGDGPDWPGQGLGEQAPGGRIEACKGPSWPAIVSHATHQVCWCVSGVPAAGCGGPDMLLIHLPHSAGQPAPYPYPSPSPAILAQPLRHSPPAPCSRLEALCCCVQAFSTALIMSRFLGLDFQARHPRARGHRAGGLWGGGRGTCDVRGQIVKRESAHAVSMLHEGM